LHDRHGDPNSHATKIFPRSGYGGTHLLRIGVTTMHGGGRLLVPTKKPDSIRRPASYPTKSIIPIPAAHLEEMMLSHEHDPFIQQGPLCRLPEILLCMKRG
jgi:hypothetical protein